MIELMRTRELLDRRWRARRPSPKTATELASTGYGWPARSHPAGLTHWKPVSRALRCTSWPRFFNPTSTACATRRRNRRRRLGGYQVCVQMLDTDFARRSSRDMSARPQAARPRARATFVDAGANVGASRRSHHARAGA
jgi:hypothetical protein